LLIIRKKAGIKIHTSLNVATKRRKFCRTLEAESVESIQPHPKP